MLVAGGPIREAIVAPPRFRLRLLGDLRVVDRGVAPIEPPRGRKARAILAVLALADSMSATRDRLTGLLWSERGESQARASLRQTLFELRGFCADPDPLIVAERDRVGLVARHLALDLDEVATAARGDDLAQLALLLADWRGELIGGVDGVDPALDDWLPGERARAQRQLVEAVSAAAERALERGEPRAARPVLETLELVDPLNEGVTRLAMRADVALGDGGSAHARCDRLRERLRGIGAKPSPETVRLLDEFSAAGVRDGAAVWDDAPAAAVAPQPPLVIITPLAMIGEGANAQLLAEGVTDDIQVELARYRDLRVMFMPQLDEARVKTAARGAIAAYVIEGSVRESNRQVRVNLKLRSLAGPMVWAKQAVFDAGDFHAAIDSIVRTVAGAAGPVIEHDVAGVQPRRIPDDYPALLKYFSARSLARRARTGPEARAAADMLEAVIASDPTLVEAHLHLARFYNTDFVYTIAGHDPTPLRARALDLTLRATELDPQNGHAQHLLGWCHLRRAAWAEAERCITTALMLHPFSADDQNAAAFGFCCLGELDAADRHAHLAMELNPFPHFEYRNDLGVIRFFQRRHLEAERFFVEAHEAPLLYRAIRVANTALGFSGGGRLDGEAARLRADLEAIWQPGAPMTPEAIEDWLWSQLPLKRDEDRALIAQGLTRAGLLRG